MVMYEINKIPVPPWETDYEKTADLHEAIGCTDPGDPEATGSPRFLKDRHVEGGGWFHVREVDAEGEAKITVRFCCPDCGLCGALDDHEISPDGTVVPSVVCPNDECDFHETVRLQGYEP
jgi:hypothetical protein